jgi:hypothetical protein
VGSGGHRRQSSTVRPYTTRPEERSRCARIEGMIERIETNRGLALAA